MDSRFFPALYDFFMAPAEHGPVGQWRSALVSPAEGLIVEVGAGTGLNFEYYRPGARVIATDPDVGMLDRARRRAATAVADVLLVAADAQALPFRGGTFTAGVVGLAMCTIPDPMCALSELRRTLQPNATLRLLEHVRFESAILGRLQDWLTPVWRRVAAGCHLNRRTVELVDSSGFRLDRVTPRLGGYLQEIVATSPGPGYADR